jgi:hypothetical protein
MTVTPASKIKAPSIAAPDPRAVEAIGRGASGLSYEEAAAICEVEIGNQEPAQPRAVEVG